ncbi:MAG: hypothetical protein K5866_02170 [Treponema sp.]|nr:hypothetical protein [Treponema sp.]
MSKKTQNIYDGIKRLFELQSKLNHLSQELDSKELDDLSFSMSQELKNLDFWVKSLYMYNGKSTSKAKQSSSRENGKKGGRPPKEISQLKKRREEIQNEIIPDLENKKSLSLDFVERQIITQKIQASEEELEFINTKLHSLNYK